MKKLLEEFDRLIRQETMIAAEDLKDGFPHSARIHHLKAAKLDELKGLTQGLK